MSTSMLLIISFCMSSKNYSMLHSEFHVFMVMLGYQVSPSSKHSFSSQEKTVDVLVVVSLFVDLTRKEMQQISVRQNK